MIKPSSIYGLFGTIFVILLLMYLGKNQNLNTLLTPYNQTVTDDSFTTSKFTSKLIFSDEFRKLSQEGLMPCIGQEWKDDLIHQFNDEQWVESRFKVDPLWSQISNDLEQIIKSRITSQLNTEIDVSVEVNSSQNATFIAVNTPCGFGRFLVSKTLNSTNYTVEEVSLNAEQDRVIFNNAVGVWITNTIIENSDLSMQSIDRSQVFNNGKTLDEGHTKLVYKGDVVVTYDIVFRGEMVIDNGFIVRRNKRFDMTNFRSSLLSREEQEEALNESFLETDENSKVKILAMTSTEFILEVQDAEDSFIYKAIRYEPL